MTKTIRAGVRISLSLSMLGLLGAATAIANDFDGSKPVLCAPTDIISCHGAGDCGRMTEAEANLPGFLYLDFERNVATGRLANGERRETQFAPPTRLEAALVIQGIASDGHRPYSFRLGDDGDMTLVMAGQGGGMLVQGTCMPMPKREGEQP